MATYILSGEADDDLDSIFEYTVRHWGLDQGFRYLKQLHECAEALATGTARFRDASQMRQGLRILRCQHHYIYCQMRIDEPALILAVFHEKMLYRLCAANCWKRSAFVSTSQTLSLLVSSRLMQPTSRV